MQCFNNPADKPQEGERLERHLFVQKETLIMQKSKAEVESEQKKASVQIQGSVVKASRGCLVGLSLVFHCYVWNAMEAQAVSNCMEP